jgi:hypothetical protein
MLLLVFYFYLGHVQVVRAVYTYVGQHVSQFYPALAVDSSIILD